MTERTYHLLCLLFALAVAGCGEDDGLGRRYPITGKVTYQGKPVASGTVNFVPESPEGRGATGTIHDGAYDDVTTLTTGDGILPGKYKVTIVAREDVDLSAAETEQPGGAPDQVTVARIAAKAKPLVPPKYSAPQTTDLAVEVTPDQRNFDFELKD